MTQFKIWYTHHQIPGPRYEAEVPDAATGRLILEHLPDYCNTGGIVYLDEDGEWVDYDEDDL